MKENNQNQQEMKENHQNQQEMKEYYKVIDVAKGVAILLVIWGHAMIPTRPYIIYSFHMPLYFAISGFLFSHRSSLKGFVKAKFDRIVIPFYFFSFLSLCVHICKNVGIGNLDFDVCKNVGKIVAGQPISLNLSLWFLPCLFSVSMIYKLLDSYFERKSIINGIIFFLSVVGYIMSFFVPPFVIPFKLDISFSAIVFFHIGFVCKKKKMMNHHPNIIIVSIFVVLWLVTAWLNKLALSRNGFKSTNMSVNCLGQYFLFYISAVCGIVSFMFLCNHIHLRVIIWLGKNSLVLMAVHFPFMLLFPWKFFLAYISNEFVAQFLMAAVLTLVSVPFCFLFKKYCPSLTGYK